MLTNQQIYDKALFGIRKQGKPSAVRGPSGRPRCKYRMQDPANPMRTLACGIGQLIPDDKYDPLWDKGGGISVATLMREYTPQMKAIGIDVNDRMAVNLLADIQSAHDGAAEASRYGGVDFMWEFESRMQHIAESYGVIYTPAEA